MAKINRLTLIQDLTSRLSGLLKGYSLPGKSGLLQEVRVFAQYVPQPSGISFSTKDQRGLKNYSSSDYESNFPCVIVQLGEMNDVEERSKTHSTCDVRLLIGIYDDAPECQGYQDVLNIQELIRQYLLEHRILANRHLLMMPMKCRLLDSETWPVYFGEMNLLFQVGRPVRNSDYVYAYEGLPTHPLI